MKLTAEEVKKVAKLANLPITPEEEEKYAEQLSAILEYVDQLNQVDTLRLSSGQASGVEPTFNVTGLSNVMSDDETVVSLSQEEALSNALQKKDGMFVTKGIFDE